MAQNAAQVMYYLNKYHDHLAGAPYGFTAGGGQLRGGGTATPVLGNAMDGADSGNGLPDENHVNNANMGTPPDGNRRRCRCTVPSATGLPCRAATAATTRRSSTTSTPTVCRTDWSCIRRHVRLSNQQGNSMGEGWSDWYAEDFLNNQGFKPDTARRRRRRHGRDLASTGLYPLPAHRLPGRRVGAMPRLPRRGPRRLHVRRLRQGRRSFQRCTPTARSGWRRYGRSARRSAPASPRRSSPAPWSCRRQRPRTWTCETR